LKISQRQKKIIEALLHAADDLTAHDIAEQTNVSSRTVHRELAEIETLLASVGIGLVKRAGIGMRLSADAERLASLETVLRHADTHEFSAHERKVLVLAALLEAEEPVKLFALAHELGVTAPTVTNDLDEAERWAARYGLRIVRRRGFGIQLEGTEARKRKAIAALALEELDDSDLFGRPEDVDAAAHPATAKLLGFVGKTRLFAVERALWNAEEAMPSGLSEAAYTEKLVLLAVAVHRFEAGRPIEKPPDAERKRPENRELSDDQERPGGDRPALGQAKPSGGADAGSAKFALFREQLGRTFPPEEEAYLSAILEESTPPAGYGPLASARTELLDTVDALVRSVEARLKLPIGRDRQLREGLLLHMEPALKRIADGSAIRNPLLAQIRKDYDELFDVVKESAKAVLPGVAIPDEEIGFLTMHFGASIERSSQLPNHLRALIVCTSGIGSSKMLAVRLAKRFPQLEIRGHVTWYEAARLSPEEYDLILSTVDLPLPPGQYVKLSPLLTDEEAERLRRFLSAFAGGTAGWAAGGAATGSGDGGGGGGAAAGSLPQAAADGAYERLSALRRYADAAVRLLDRLFVGELPTASRTIAAALAEACRRLPGLDAPDAVARELLDREAQGSIVIPDSELALFHARSEYVDAPTLALFGCAKPLELGPDGRRVGQMMLMLGPKRLPKPELELLSEISAMLLLPDFIDALRTGDAGVVKAFIAGQLELYIKTNIDRREIP